jgi:hypothetical protein
MSRRVELVRPACSLSGADTAKVSSGKSAVGTTSRSTGGELKARPLAGSRSRWRRVYQQALISVIKRHLPTRQPPEAVRVNCVSAGA